LYIGQPARDRLVCLDINQGTRPGVVEVIGITIGLAVRLAWPSVPLSPSTTKKENVRNHGEYAMKTRDLVRMGIPAGACAEEAKRLLQRGQANRRGALNVIEDLRRVAGAPAGHASDPEYGRLAGLLTEYAAAQGAFTPRAGDAPYRVWGEGLEATALQQMKNACRLPVAVAGALMPDAHQGYGLPIGGVLATHDAVIPYAVGVDIACRMKMTVLDLPLGALTTDQPRLARALERETRFGVGGTFKDRRQHDVMDEDWRVTPVTASLKDRAWAQLGTSGSGNHFVEFGALTVLDASVGLPRGEYVALLSHSGSRGAGAHVAQHYSRLAKSLHPELPSELGNLAWLDLASEPGQEYWAAMELMGRYAAASHHLIHRHVARALGVEVRLDVENHHNFAWRERHRLPDGSEAEVIVHRKGATPADAGVLGVIPGSMATPGYIVRGKGSEASLRSASHGAGRRMSRTAANAQFTWEAAQRFLTARGVTLISAGLDEVPMAYKDIEEVMRAQDDLVERLARFEPRLVKMAPAGERPED
jgi:tRNA-splicing ligase RtcB